MHYKEFSVQFYAVLYQKLYILVFLAIAQLRTIVIRIWQLMLVKDLTMKIKMYFNSIKDNQQRYISTVKKTNRAENYLYPITEQSRYNVSLYQATKFIHEHTHRFSSVSKIVLSFRFRSIEFQKKRSLLFFLVLELLSAQKPIASLSSRNLQSWKIRKGRLVGCKVTLRNDSLNNFLDTFLLTLPRREKLYPYNSFNVANKGIIDKTTKALRIGKSTKDEGISKLRSSRRKRNNQSLSFRFGELVLFYPVEIGIGLHPDLSYRYRNCAFSSVSKEEREFHLRTLAFPLR